MAVFLIMGCAWADDFVKVNINGVDYDPKPVEKQHLVWYQQHGQNYDQAARDLAVHYFGDEIQEAMVEDWKQRHFDAGKMPYDITVGEIWIQNRQGVYWGNGDFFRNGEKLEASDCLISPEDAARWEAISKQEALPIICNSAGKELVKDWKFPSITELQNTWHESPAPFDTVEGINQTIETFNAFTEQLCSDFVQTCGEVATAYLSLVAGGAGGISTGGAGGGGGQQSGWGRKKNDDDWPRRKPGLMDQHPKGRFKR